MTEHTVNARWENREGILNLSGVDGSTYVPSALEIFQAEFREIDRIKNYVIYKPSDEIEDFSFSRFPLKLSAKISINQDESDSVFFLNIFGENDIQKIKIENPVTRKSDYSIIDRVWYPYERGSLEEIRRIFKENSIPEGGELTLKQYFILRKEPSAIIPFLLQDDINKIHSVLKPVQIPSSFVGQLYPYQDDGFKWLMMINREEIGCILADEMGLGKTIQIICLITNNIEENKRPSLIVVPATLLENWRREFVKFAPSVTTYIHIGSERTGFPSVLNQYDVVITSYSTLIRDMPLISMISWDIVVLDEAQAIKTPEAERTKAVKEIKRRISIAVTGTPVENRLTDLWSIMDFAIPDLLGERSEFESYFENDVGGAKVLEPLVRPVILRRRINEVAKDLPERIDIPQAISMPLTLAKEYESVRQKIIEKYGTVGNLVSLIKLRQFCTHPTLVSDIKGEPEKINPKYQRLLEILEEIFENGEQVLIFTSFRKMIDLLVEDIKKRFNVWTDWIDGRVTVSKRQPIVDEFNNKNAPAALILNPRAAGTGLNLTGANHVIHYNLEWNPAVEDQASARAHRKGQEKPVTVHKLFFVNTVEEIIVERLDKKREIADTVVTGVKGADSDYTDIMRALEITPFRGGA